MKPKIEFLNNSKKNRIVKQLEKEYGIIKLPYLLIKSGNNKIRIFSGSLSKEELNLLGKNLHVETIGARLCNVEKDGIRLNFDILNLPEISSQIKKNIIELTNEEKIKWLKGNNLENKKSKTKFPIIKNKNDFLGVGRTQGDFIKNYVPKERRGQVFKVN